MEECMKERYGLAKERIREIITEETVKKPFGDFFRNRAKFLSMAADVMDESAAEPVSYTHLDVYKRQIFISATVPLMGMLR